MTKTRSIIGLRNGLIAGLLLWVLIILTGHSFGQLNISGDPPLPIAYGGTAGATATAARAALSAAVLGSNGDITSLTGLTAAPSILGSGDQVMVVRSSSGDGSTAGYELRGAGTNADWMLITNRSDLTGAPDSVCLYKLAGTTGCKFIVTDGAAVTTGVTSTVTITTANLQMRGNDVLKDGLPTCSGAGCVMGATSTNTSMNMTTTTTGAADITVTFSAAFDNAPSCWANNDTTGNLLRATTVAVGSIHVEGTTVSGDTLRVGCIGN